MTPQDTVLKFWDVMNTNDFEAATALLADDYECYWPQSGELIRGRDNFARINTAYPANGPWKFVINRLLSQGDEVVTDVTVTDGVITARAITFFTVKHGAIVKQIEYWPEDYEAPTWRRAWVEIVVK